MPALWAAAAGALLVMGVDAVRFSPMAAVVALPVAATWASGVRVPSESRWSVGGRLARRGAMAWCVALTVFAVVRLPDWGVPDPSSYPSPALIHAIPAGSRVLAEYDDGGPILLDRWADGVRVADDGRNDVFGADVLLHVEGLINGRPGAVEEVTTEHVGALVLLPSRPLVRQALAAGWRVTARDGQRVLVLPPSTGSR